LPGKVPVHAAVATPGFGHNPVDWDQQRQAGVDSPGSYSEKVHKVAREADLGVVSNLGLMDSPIVAIGS
jgi:hypothetical protein